MDPFNPIIKRFLLSRLVSAYQDKYVDRDGQRFNKKLLKHYQEVSFPNFVDFVIRDVKKSCK